MKRSIALFLAITVMLACGCIFASAESDGSAVSETDTESPLYKKTVLFVGDSICEAAVEWGTSNVGWAGRIMNWNKMSGFNKGKSGASISDCRGENTVIAQLKAQEKNKDKFDYVIMHGGVNDAWDSAPVGEMTEGFDGPFDTSTFAGGLEATFKYAKESFTNAYFGYIINFSLPSAKYGRLSDMSEYFALAKQICDKWEIPYLDFYFDDDFNNNVMMTRSMRFLKDFIHPNADGYGVIAPYINDWMETLEAKANEKEDSSIAESSIPVSEPDSSVAEESKGNGADLIVYTVCGIIVACAAVLVVVVAKKKK